MLHNFIHTEKHQNKIYEDIIIDDGEIREVCLNHHNGEDSSNELIPIIKYYDQFASSIRRKIPMKTISMCDYENGKIDFKEIRKEIEERQHSAYKLYNYIYFSTELTRIVESMDYARNSLRNHLLLLAVNLAINGYYMGTLKIVNSKIILTNNEKNSVSATKKEDLLSAKDAEMHHSLTINNANSESTNNLMKEKSRNIGKEKAIK